MHKIIQINLAGQAISIDEVAYEKLRNYLDSVEKHFSNTDSGNEIFEDIEARIAEMFIQKIKAGKTFIDMAEVDETIEIMGSPSDMDQEAEEEAEPQYRQQKQYQDHSKKLFRDGDDKILGGICSGLAAYFGLDTSMVRLAFILAFIIFGFGLPIYILLWIVVPEAKTPQDRSRMRGDYLDIDSIAKKVRNEAEQVANNIKKNSNLSRGVHQIGTAFQNLVYSLGKIAGAFILVGLVIAGVALITFFISAISGGTIHLRSSIFSMPQLFESSVLSIMFLISLLFVILIPLAAVAYYLISFIFDTPYRRIGTKAVFAIWLICLGTMVATAITGAQHIKYEEFENIKIEKIDDANTV
ncbi:PspC domain-containing protein [bacterium]|nr:PspC domain-containing protein [bacterium]